MFDSFLFVYFVYESYDSLIIIIIIIIIIYNGVWNKPKIFIDRISTDRYHISQRAIIKIGLKPYQYIIS